MGQYHKTVNLDKKQFIHPHALGDGLKLLEQCGWSPGGTNDALHMLLAVSSGRGGGDFQSDSPLIGSWGGDRIAVIGDYAEPTDIPGVDAQAIYGQCGDDGEFKDITPELIPVMEQEYELAYVGGGWCHRFQLRDISGFEMSHGVGDRTCVINGKSYAASAVRKALKDYFAIRDPRRGEKVTVADLGLSPLGAAAN